MPKVLFQMYIDKKQIDFIAKESYDTGKSRARIVRDAIDDYRKNKLEGDERKVSIQKFVDNYNIEEEAQMKRK